MPHLKRLATFIGLLAALVCRGAEPPIKLAPSARFELLAMEPSLHLVEGDITQGHATLTRLGGQAPTESMRQYHVEFPVFHFSPGRIVFQFVPTGTGPVRLRLGGVREAFSKDVFFKQEVSWSGIELRGATWSGESTAISATPVTSWHGGPVDLTIAVTENKKVHLVLNAQAVRTADMEEMKPIRGGSSPAHKARKRFSQGVVFRQWLELEPRNSGRLTYSEADLVNVKGEGFDHVRVPVAWHQHLQRGNALSPDAYAEVDALVAAAERQGMGIILALHGFGELATNPIAGSARFFALWDQVARHYAGRGSFLAFELLDEPVGNIPTKTLMTVYSEVIPAIRRISPDRTLFVPPSGSGTYTHLGRLRLPDEDDNLIVSLDCSEPAMFALQGSNGSSLRNIVFPGPPKTPLTAPEGVKLSSEEQRWLGRYNTKSGDLNPSHPRAIEDLLSFVARWSEFHGRPVYLGQLGCSAGIDPVSRVKYAEAFRIAAEARGLGWAFRGWKDDAYPYWDRKSNKALPGLKEALLPVSSVPAPAVQAQVSGRLAQVEAKISRQINQSLMAVGVLFVLAVLVAVWWSRRNHQQLLAVARRQAAVAPDDQEAIREGVIRQLAASMVDSALPRMAAERKELLLIQERAAQEIAELERRLEAAQAPLQARLQAYERQIAELQAQLLKKDQENEALIRAKIRMTQERLERFRSQSKTETELN
ncbi:MAG: hypothetical protein FJ405_03090 [Verrucomicrobia bacterium]|nr:hypothetical protein [Verrucomicrobiota bacterium]